MIPSYVATENLKSKAWNSRPPEKVLIQFSSAATGLSNTEATKHDSDRQPERVERRQTQRRAADFLMTITRDQSHTTQSAPLPSGADSFVLEIQKISAILGLAFKKFLLIDGTQRAGAFAFNAFFSLFPLMILFVTFVSSFIDRNIAAAEVIAYIESFVPITGEMQDYIFTVISGVINSREKATTIASLVLVWTAIQCFTTLIVATNRAWGSEVYNWWRLPLKSLTLFGTTAGSILFGMAVPVMIRMTRGWLFPMHDFRSWVYDLGSFFIPLVVVFFGLCLFYRFTPSRPTRFAEVWSAALCATVLLRASESLFILYLKNFATLNAVYGAFGGIMALLLWIYVSGSVFIYGACLCAGQAEIRALSLKTTVP
ncbi:MAG: YihY/virulence factor BrkB family protein [Desulforhopalus sp.]